MTCHDGEKQGTFPAITYVRHRDLYVMHTCTSYYTLFQYATSTGNTIEVLKSKKNKCCQRPAPFNNIFHIYPYLEATRILAPSIFCYRKIPGQCRSTYHNTSRSRTSEYLTFCAFFEFKGPWKQNRNTKTLRKKLKITSSVFSSFLNCTLS